MKSHKEILTNIWKNKEALEKALGLPYVFIRSTEFIIDRETGEAADLVFQDMFDDYQGLPEATLFVLELKKNRGDHELLGQIKKYMNVFEKMIPYGHWGKVRGLAVARDFTDSCLKLLWKDKIRTFLYHEDCNGYPILTEKKIRRTAVLNDYQMRLFNECSIA